VRPVLNPAQHGQQLGRFDLRNGPLADPREYIPFESAQDTFAVARRPALRKLPVPFAGDSFEALRARLRLFFCLSASPGSMPAASCWREASRFSRAAFNFTSG